MNDFDWEREFPQTSKSFHNKVHETLAQLPEGEENIIMNKKISFKGALIFALIAVLALATAAYAVGKAQSTVSHSYRSAEDSQFPTHAQVEKAIDASPKLIEKFDNGYVFKEKRIAKSSDMDGEGNTVRSYEVFNFQYTNGSDMVDLSVEHQNPNRDFSEGYTQTGYNGVTLYSLEYILKTVPLGYVMTEQDKASGKVVFGTMGGDMVDSSKVKMLLWDDGGVSYSLLTMDSSLQSHELEAMAKQLIDQKA